MTRPAAVPVGSPVARATGLVVFAACCFGSISVLVNLGTARGVGLITLLVWRYAIGGVLLAVAAGGPRMLALPRRDLFRALLIGGVGQAVVSITSLSALRYIPAATLAFLFYTYPAWIAAIAAVRRTEALTTRRVVALALSFAGIAAMVGAPGAEELHPAGVVLALGSAILYALYVPAVGRLQETLAPTVVATCMSAGALVALVAASPAFGGISLRLSPTVLLIVVLLGVISTALGFLAFLRGLSVIGPVRTGIIATIEPFWTSLLAALVLAERLTLTTIVGGVLIAAAVVVIQWTRDGRAQAVGDGLAE